MNQLIEDHQLKHLVKKAREFQSMGNYLHSVQILTSIINNYPEYTDAYFQLAEIHEKLGNINPSVNYFNNYLEKYPANKEVRLFLGKYLLKNEKYDEAIETLSYFMPEEEPDIAFLLGLAHFKLQDFELAKIYFLSFLTNVNDTELRTESFFMLFKIEIGLNNFEQALSYSKRIESVYNRNWEFNYLLAKTYLNLNMFTHAITPVERAARLNPKESLIYELAGRIYFKTGEYDKAEKYFLKFLETAEEANPDIYLNLGESCLKLNKLGKALDYFKTVLKIEPENQAAIQGAQIAVNKLKE